VSSMPESSPAGQNAGGRRRASRWAIAALAVVGVLLLGFIAIQFVPVNRTNPPVTTQIKWDSAQTEALATRACMDCHSNQTTWPWYSYVAPASWLIYYDVQRGRQELDLSTLGTAGGPGQFTSHSGDLAYQVGQILAGSGQGEGERGEFRGQRPEGQRPEGQFQGQRPQQGQQGAGGATRNFSGFAARRIQEVIQNGTMPPEKYTLIHPSAKLTDAERQQLLEGFTNTLSQTAAQ
jgi:hypothetical protein